RQTAAGAGEGAPGCREADEGRWPRYADRSAVVGDRGLAGPGATVRHKAPVKAGGGDRDAATTRGRDRRRGRERDGLAAAHGPGALLRNSEEEAWADPRLSDGGARPGLSHRRPGAGMRRAIQDATACRKALLRLPKLGLGELRQQWRVLYKAEASPYLSRELLLRAVAYRMQQVALGGLRPERQRQLRQFAQQLNGSQEGRIRPRPELKPGTRLVREWQGRTYDVVVLDDGFSWQGTSYREVDPFSWSPSGFQRRLFRCPRRVRPIHLSFVARWSIWFALDVIPPTLPASSSRQRSLSATGLRKPTGKRAAGRRRVAG